MSLSALCELQPIDHRILLDAGLRTDFTSFVQKSFGTVSPGQSYLPNWHVEAICHELTKVADGETKRLIITMPPRHLKSICSSVALPAWLLGRDPTRRIVCVSYSRELAQKHSHDFRRVVNSDWYRRIFPGTRIDPAKNTQAECATVKGGSRLSTSVGGTLTGRGGNLIVVDDPMKPADALSDIRRERATEWCRSTLFSRLDNKQDDAFIVIMQRLHVDDLAGYLLQQGGWKHLNLPAIAEIDERIEIGPNLYYSRKMGELLHPAREPQGVLETIKKDMGSAAFVAQYQQTPVPAGGNMIKWEWFQWYDPNPIFRFERTIISWDTAVKDNELADYSVATVWGQSGDFYYLRDLVRLRLDHPSLRRKVFELYDRWEKPTILLEDAGSGSSLIQELRAMNIPAIAIRPEGTKVMRMSAQSPKIEGGAVFLPRNAAWLDDLRTEILAFPFGSHDDQVDSISQALFWMSQPRRRLMVVGA